MSADADAEDATDDQASAWRVLVQPPAQRSLGRIAPRYREALVSFIFGGLAANPRRRGKPLGADLDGLWSARRGDFRVIYRLDEQTLTLHVRQIGARADVYRPE